MRPAPRGTVPAREGTTHSSRRTGCPRQVRGPAAGGATAGGKLRDERGGRHARGATSEGRESVGRLLRVGDRTPRRPTRPARSGCCPRPSLRAGVLHVRQIDFRRGRGNRRVWWRNNDGLLCRNRLRCLNGRRRRVDLGRREWSGRRDHCGCGRRAGGHGRQHHLLAVRAPDLLAEQLDGHAHTAATERTWEGDRW